MVSSPRSHIGEKVEMLAKVLSCALVGLEGELNRIPGESPIA